MHDSWSVLLTFLAIVGLSTGTVIANCSVEDSRHENWDGRAVEVDFGCVFLLINIPVCVLLTKCSVWALSCP